MNAKERINISCPGCGKRFSLSTKWADRVVQCKRCASYFVVPTQANRKFETAAFASQSQIRAIQINTGQVHVKPAPSGFTPPTGSRTGSTSGQMRVPKAKPPATPGMRPKSGTSAADSKNRARPQPQAFKESVGSSDSSTNVAKFLSEEMDIPMDPSDLSFTKEKKPHSEKTLPPIPLDDEETRIVSAPEDEIIEPVFEEEELLEPTFEEEELLEPLFDDEEPVVSAEASKSKAEFGGSLLDDELLRDPSADDEEDDLLDAPDAGDSTTAVGQKVCDACGVLVNKNLDICPNCGYNFVTGEDPFGDEFDI